MPKVDAIRMTIEIAISYQGTVLIAIRENIAMGEVRGKYEQIIIIVLSTVPLLIEKITTISAPIKINVIGITEVLISSSFEAVDPTAPNINA